MIAIIRPEEPIISSWLRSDCVFHYALFTLFASQAFEELHAPI